MRIPVLRSILWGGREGRREEGEKEVGIQSKIEMLNM
jgi:hypothetical protein